MKSYRKIVRMMLVLALVANVALDGAPALAGATGGPGRIFILLVCDGLRPDLVTQQNMPNLYALGRQGVRFDHHHSLYPTLTMVNAAALSTGAQPGVSGLLANLMYFKPVLGSKISAGSNLADLIKQTQFLESVKFLAQLNGPGGLDGHLLALDTVAQETEREGGYIAILGKAGPAFLFDNRVALLKDGRDLLDQPHADFLFATDDLTAQAPAQTGAAPIKPPGDSGNTLVEALLTSARDNFYTGVAIERALPAAEAAAKSGRPALIVLWQRDPDVTQHRAGLGTAEDLQALANVDANIGRIRGALINAGLADRADLMVVSDHGFATIRMRIDLSGLLVAAGLKKSADSTDLVIARNGASDLLYLSPDAFPSTESRRAILQKIVEFAEAQEWCGPIFVRDPAPPDPHHRRDHHGDYLGWIDGTFSEAAVGIYNKERSPDLVLSFRELPDLDNAALTGPGHPAFTVDAKGQHSVTNLSKEVVRPVPGLNYSDGSAKGTTTGMGSHGAAGTRELHNVCAAIGPDFRRAFVDRAPTGNADVTPTIEKILRLEPNVGPGGVYATGRVMEEALSAGEHGPGIARLIRMTTELDLAGVKVITTLSATQLGRRLYLDDSSVEHIPLGHSP
jgi:type I phosphodiesterase/nucleotide pyrophosphatase